MSTEFSWPWQYDFPPFFTMQENADTYEKQMNMWCDLVIAYQKHKNQPNLNIQTASSSPLFNNMSLNRKLRQSDIEKVLAVLNKKGNLEWQDKNKTSCLILWKTADQWADCVYSWVSKNGMANTVCTLYEVTKSENNANEEFYELDDSLLLRAIKILETRGKAELIGNDGVKFF